MAQLAGVAAAAHHRRSVSMRSQRSASRDSVFPSQFMSPRLLTARSAQGLANRPGPDDEDELDTSAMERWASQIASRRPWLPRAIVHEGPARVRRVRPAVERLFVLLNDPSESQLGSLIASFVMAVIVLAVVASIVETLPSLSVFKDGCHMCRSLSEDERQNATLVAEREDLAEECASCEPIVPSAFFVVETFCIVVFTVEYGLRLLTAHSVVPPPRVAGEYDFVLDPNTSPPSSPPPPPARVRSAFNLSEMRISESHSDFGALPGEDGDSSNSNREGEDKGWKERGRGLRGRVWAGLWATARFAADPLNVVDFVAIFPFYLQLALGDGSGSSLSVVRVLRAVRVVRVLKFGRFSESMQLFISVITSSSLAMTILLLFGLVSMLIFGTLIFFTEQGSWNPATGRYERSSPFEVGETEVSPFKSVPACFWWVVTTTTTVGFGDMVPSSDLGKLIGSITMYVGVVFISMPITILSTRFAELYQLDTLKRERDARIRTMAAVGIHTLLRYRKLLPLRRAWNSWSALLDGDDGDNAEHKIRQMFRDEVLQFCREGEVNAVAAKGKFRDGAVRGEVAQRLAAAQLSIERELACMRKLVDSLQPSPPHFSRPQPRAVLSEPRLAYQSQSDQHGQGPNLRRVQSDHVGDHRPREVEMAVMGSRGGEGGEGSDGVVERPKGAGQGRTVRFSPEHEVATVRGDSKRELEEHAKEPRAEAGAGVEEKGEEEEEEEEEGAGSGAVDTSRLQAVEARLAGLEGAVADIKRMLAQSLRANEQ